MQGRVLAMSKRFFKKECYYIPPKSKQKDQILMVCNSSPFLKKRFDIVSRSLKAIGAIPTPPPHHPSTHHLPPQTTFLHTPPSSTHHLLPHTPHTTYHTPPFPPQMANPPDFNHIFLSLTNATAKVQEAMNEINKAAVELLKMKKFHEELKDAMLMSARNFDEQINRVYVNPLIPF